MPIGPRAEGAYTDGAPVARELLAELHAVTGATAPPAAPPPRTPPDKGLVLAECDRGADGTLVLAWCSYDGHPYLSLRVWGRDGWPTKAGVSIRLRELEPVMRGLLAAERLRRRRAEGAP